VRVFFIILVAIFFIGCESLDKNHGIFQKDKTYQKAIRNTQKGEIINSLETKGVIVATYLTPLYEEYSEGENFLVGIYTNSIVNENLALDDENYNLVLENEQNLKIEEIDKNHKVFQNMPFINEWFRYYLVKGEEREVLNLTFLHKDFGSVKLHFAK